MYMHGSSARETALSVSQGKREVANDYAKKTDVDSGYWARGTANFKLCLLRLHAGCGGGGGVEGMEWAWEANLSLLLISKNSSPAIRSLSLNILYP